MEQLKARKRKKEEKTDRRKERKRERKREGGRKEGKRERAKEDEEKRERVMGGEQGRVFAHLAPVRMLRSLLADTRYRSRKQR